MAGCVSSGSMGCKHYQRYCKILAPCCNKVFSCRFCHNEVSDHSINRYNVKKVVCNMCNKMQNVAEKCINCKTPFGLYVCLLCNLFDNEDKEQFHCYGCGLCRIGGKQNYFHCDKCDFCYAWRLHDNHTCVEKASQRDCPICVEDLHTSRTAAHVPPCGHLIHEHCFQRVQSEYKSCILCRKPY